MTAVAAASTAKVDVTTPQCKMEPDQHIEVWRETIVMENTTVLQIGFAKTQHLAQITKVDTATGTQTFAHVKKREPIGL